MAATLKQIAQKTGFSLPTVHQILNGYDVPFAEATRKKVLAAAAEMNRTLLRGRW
jgi:LacI family transcriptional regulator